MVARIPTHTHTLMIPPTYMVAQYQVKAHSKGISQHPLKMCICDFDLNALFCCWSNRIAGVKAIGFFYFVANFLSLIWPIYQINYYRSNSTAVDNTTLVHIPFLQNGTYEQLLVFAIIFLLVGVVCSAALVWAAMQVKMTQKSLI